MSPSGEAVVEILQNEPELILQLPTCAGMHLPFGTRVAATLADSNLSDRDANGDGTGHTLTLLSDNVFAFKGGGAKIARYDRYIQALAPSKARKPLDELMRSELKNDFIDGLIDEGHLQGARQMMLQLLDNRFSVPEDIRERVEDCTDMAKIDVWFDRAITATSLGEVSAELLVT